MPWYRLDAPPENPQLHHQTELVPRNDEQYAAMHLPVKYSKKDRLVQVLLFIFGGGWIRAIFLLIASLIAIILESPFYLIDYMPSFIRNHFYQYQVIVARIFVRLMLFGVGVFKINVKGKPHKDARNLIYNHTSITDGPLIFVYKPFTMVMKSGVKSVPYFGKLFSSVNTCFVDRSATHGNSHFLVKCMEDHNLPPIAIAPEGTISNGSALFKFRTGGFIANEMIQPVTLQYHMYFSYCGATINWLSDSLFDFLWQVLCCPLITCDLTFHDPITVEQMKGKTPAEKAVEAELIMANYLGVLAGDRTSHEIFLKKQEDEKKPEEKKVLVDKQKCKSL
ncbi:Acyltransferase family protein [Histomonas meleagridis]|uniref:Acyltransferase family protein n=1 Tax=Histomonas meleagridis TaxID=135588 RepID=UPI003559E403|nr:Acyltransferase family protein [Histomonas meleagridis]KAH0807116.1 Acyltransferase family protein [Histomonas meleagridis]